MAQRRDSFFLPDKKQKTFVNDGKKEIKKPVKMAQRRNSVFLPDKKQKTFVNDGKKEIKKPVKMAQRRDSVFLPDQKQKTFVNDGKKEFKKPENKIKQQRNFDQNRDRLQEPKEDIPEGSKKPFDKKAYRLKKYSKKYKLEQYEEQRRKKLLHQYHKSLKDDMAGTYKSKAFDEDATDSSQGNLGKFVRHPDLIKEADNKVVVKTKKDPYWKAKEHFKKIKQEKLEKKEQAEKAKLERAQKNAEYKKKKQERYKKLSVKNKKGQPVMSMRMELLLDKIKAN